MIQIFNLQNEDEFFHSLALQKISEEKFRDLVFLTSIFPQILEKIEKHEDFERKDFQSTQDIRFYLMKKLILDNDVTSAKLLITDKLT